MTGLHDIKCFLLDMDGTLYLSGNLITGAAEAVARMKKGARVLYITNNSSATRAAYYDKLSRFGFELKPQDIYGSTHAAIDYLNEYHRGRRVYLCATPEVTEEFAAAGVKLVEDAPDIALMTFDKTLTYDKLRLFCEFVTGGALYVATHPDKVCPMPNGSIPDIGSFIRAIKCATGKNPNVICGKPYKAFGKRILKLTGLNPHQIAMVGDRLTTDYRFAKNCGFTSVTVLSGEATLSDIKKLKKQPDYVLKSIAEWDKE
jgi:HAD superfamily hydrolase (TIGR01450 family)